MAAGLPQDLQERVERARAALEARDDGHLPLPQRRALKEALGPDDPPPSPGRIRRVELGRLAADRALERWRAELPGDERPERMFELARSFLAAGEDPGAADRERGRFWSDLDDMASSISWPALMAGYASTAVLATALYGDTGAEVPDGTDDPDVDPELQPADYLASMAAGGGVHPDAPANDAESRREFWRWYLDVAVPAAWSAGDASPS